jgi:subtilisin family serine protease
MTSSKLKAHVTITKPGYALIQKSRVFEGRLGVRAADTAISPDGNDQNGGDRDVWREVALKDLPSVGRLEIGEVAREVRAPLYRSNVDLFQTVDWVEPIGAMELEFEDGDEAGGEDDVSLLGSGSQNCGGDLTDNWHLEQISANEAWNVVGQQPGSGVKIAHLDTGIVKQTVSPILGDRLLADESFDFMDGRTGCVDHWGTGKFQQPGHGTKTISILAADGLVGPNSTPYRGLAFKSSVIPIVIGSSVIHFVDNRMAAGLRHAVRKGAAVISISAGGLPSQYWAEMVNLAYDAGVVVVAAAGNNIKWHAFRSPSWVVWPAAFERVIAVGGVMRGGERYYFDSHGSMSGNFGPELDICAPTPCAPWVKPQNENGAGVLEFGQGTSAATPQVAGAAAIWLAHHKNDPNLPELGDPNDGWRRVESVRFALQMSANSEGCKDFQHNWFGSGRLNIAKALKYKPRTDLPKMPPCSIKSELARFLKRSLNSISRDPRVIFEGMTSWWNHLVNGG